MSLLQLIVLNNLVTNSIGDQFLFFLMCLSDFREQLVVIGSLNIVLKFLKDCHSLFDGAVVSGGHR